MCIQYLKINSMKIIIILTTFFSSVVFAQELITKHNFENIQYVEDIEWYGDEIYCSGYTFNTKINDGNATDAYLIRYNKNLSSVFKEKICKLLYVLISSNWF